MQGDLLCLLSFFKWQAGVSNIFNLFRDRAFEPFLSYMLKMSCEKGIDKKVVCSAASSEHTFDIMNIACEMYKPSDAKTTEMKT